jgi:hypothetical protein
MTSQYFIFTIFTTVGYGDIHASTNAELIFAILTMIFGVIFFSVTIGLLSTILERLDNKAIFLQKKNHVLTEFCKESKIGPELQGKLRRQLANPAAINPFEWASKKMIFDEIPLNLRYDIAMNMNKSQFAEISLFTMSDDKYFAVKVIPLLVALDLSPGEIIWNQGDQPEAVYFIVKGEVWFYADNEYYIPDSLAKTSSEDTAPGARPKPEVEATDLTKVNHSSPA